MCVQFTPEELEAFAAVKRASTWRTANPGKAILTRCCCAEGGPTASACAKGLLSFPELERFEWTTTLTSVCCPEGAHCPWAAGGH